MEFPSSMRRKHIYKIGDAALLGQTFRGYFGHSYIRLQRVGYPCPSDISININLLMVKSDRIRIKKIILKYHQIPIHPHGFTIFYHGAPWGTSKSPGSIGQKLMAIWAPNLQRLRAEIIIEVPPPKMGGFPVKIFRMFP